MKYNLVRWGPEFEACEELLDDIHTERITFFTDDQGNWYAQVTTNQDRYVTRTMWQITDDEAINEELLRILDMARFAE